MPRASCLRQSEGSAPSHQRLNVGHPDHDSCHCVAYAKRGSVANRSGKARFFAPRFFCWALRCHDSVRFASVLRFFAPLREPEEARRGEAKRGKAKKRAMPAEAQNTEEEARIVATAVFCSGLDDGIVRSLRRLRVHIYDILLLAVHFLTPELLWTRQSLVCTFLVLEVFWEV